MFEQNNVGVRVINPIAANILNIMATNTTDFTIQEKVKEYYDAAMEIRDNLNGNKLFRLMVSVHSQMYIFYRPNR
jgi:hypothetical protein